MSKFGGLGQLGRSIEGKWQLPLLFCSLGLLALALVTLHARQPEVPFEKYIAHIIALQKGGFYAEAAALIERLLAEGRSEDETAQLRRHMARTIYLGEGQGGAHRGDRAEAIVYNHREANEADLQPAASDLAQMARAYEWLGESEEAIAHYREALEVGPDQPNRIRRRIIELAGSLPGATGQDLMAEIDDLITHSQDLPEDLLWGVERKVELLVDGGRLEAARDLLAETRPKLAETALQPELDYLDALTSFHAGDYDQAERLLRSLRDSLDRRNELVAKSGWLLGRVDYQDARPLYALSAFEDVLGAFADGPYAAASKLGRAESLAALERYDEAAEGYAEVVELVERGGQGRLVDAVAVRASLTTLYQSLREAGRSDQALRFVELAARLVDPQDLSKTSMYLASVASIHEELGRKARAEADSLTQVEDSGSRRQLGEAAKSHFASAGKALLKLSQLNVSHEPTAADAAWRAAEDFDLAGQTARVIEVLTGFVADRPLNSRTPRALFRLGQAYQARHQLDAAIATYRRLLQEFPRTLAAFDSYVPLAQCFVAKGKQYYDQAEHVLLRVLEEDPTGPGFHTPRAPQFREALFKLGELYARRSSHEAAVSRLEDFLEYYPKDVRATRVRFMLAESYRGSGLQLRARSDAAAQIKLQEQLTEEFRTRVRKAATLYEQVIAEYEKSATELLQAKELLYLQLSHLYLADCYFDLGEYDQAIRLYEKAVYRYQDDPLVLPAYVQIVHSYYRLGDLHRAATALERARWRLRQMPLEQFSDPVLNKDEEWWRQWWTETLSWMDGCGVLVE
jgi:tetratricopeptide (TPR) repeat protein